MKYLLKIYAGKGFTIAVIDEEDWGLEVKAESTLRECSSMELFDSKIEAIDEARKNFSKEFFNKLF
jgi:hypothetical protein